MHVLHGNRPYALSRNSHPLTPYAPTGEYIYKNVIKHVMDKIDLVYKDIEKFEQLSMDINNVDIDKNWNDYIKGKAYNYDVLNLDKSNIKNVDIIITSPPFASSIKFYSQNWMRLWFSGWEEEDFKNAEKVYLDSIQKNNLEIYKVFFEKMSILLKPKGKMILHLGKTKNIDMAEELSTYSEKYFDTIFMGNEDVSKLEKHGIKDKGGTTHHQYLFLEKK